MFTEALNQYPTPWLSAIGLIIFVCVFVGILFCSLRNSRTTHYQQVSLLPFKEEETPRE